MNITKKLIAVFLTSLIALTLTTGAFAATLPEAPSTIYVLDEANVLSSSTENEIVKRGNALFGMTGAQIVIVTSKDTGYSDMETFSYDLFNQWGIGAVDLNNGVLLTMEPSSGRIWAMVGAGLEMEFPADVLNTILEDMVYGPYDNGDCDTAVMNFYNEIYGRLEDRYNVDTDDWDGVTYNYVQGGETSSGTVEAVIALIVFIVVFLIIYKAITTAKRHGNSLPFFIFGNPTPRYYYRRPTHHYTSHNSGGFSYRGGGGFGGGFGGGGSRGGGAGRR